MFTAEQQQLYNQSYNAYQKLSGFLENYAASSGNRGIVRRGELQMQGILTEIGLSSGKPLTDEEQMFIRSLISDGEALREEIPGYGKYFLDINEQTYRALAPSTG